MSALRTEGGEILRMGKFGSIRTDGTLLERFSSNTSETVVSPLPNGWTDASEAYGDAFDPLGVVNGQVVIRELRVASRLGRPYVPDPLNVGDDYRNYPGLALPAIGFAHRPFPTSAINITMEGAGLCEEVGLDPHCEAAIIFNVVPGTDRLAMGCWASSFPVYGAVMFLGSIGIRPELFVIDQIAPFDHVYGQTHSFQIRSTGTHYTVWEDGVQLPTVKGDHFGEDPPAPWNVDLGLAPIPIPDEMIGSNLHGFALDNHLAAYDDDTHEPSIAKLHGLGTINEILIQSP